MATRNAQLSKKVVYWMDTLNGKIKMGLPEEFPAPHFHEKIVCHTVADAERWSRKMREQDAREAQQYADQRGAYEEMVKSRIRSDLHQCMANARNNLNRDFMKLYLERSASHGSDPTRALRESYLHAEGYESGH